ncbi:hypothetical protein ABPG72_008660 [Tetrahymena utriculariae]
MSPVIDKNNNFQCYNNMDIIQYIYIKNNQYFILIQFEYEIDFFNQVIQNAGINKVFSFSISQVSSIYYQVVSYSISASDQITLSIELKKDFLRTFGQLIFLKSDIFQNFKHQAILNPVYLKKPFQFQIGPYFMQKNFYIDIKLSSALNQYAVDFIRNFQVLFYLVNSAQPTVMLLLVDVSIPPNFYKFVCEIGNLVFKNVSEYSQTQFQNTYTFGEQNIESYSNSTEIYQFDRVGFSNSYLANAEMIFYKYMICLLLIFFFKIIENITFLQKEKKKIRKLTIKMKKFFMIRIIAETKINFLVNILSIMIQFSNVEQVNYLSRQSFYSSIFILLIILSFSFYFYREYNSNRFNQENNFFEILHGKLDKNKIGKSWQVKNFFFISLLKKFFLLFIMFSFNKNSLNICYIFSIINAISGVYTIYLRPHDYIYRDILKGIADIILSYIWIFMIYFNYLFKSIQGDVTLSDEQVDSILLKGYIASLVTIVYNIIFLLIFLIEILLKIYSKFFKKKTINFIIKMKESKESEQKSVLIDEQFQDNNDFKINKKIVYEQN